MEEEKPGMDNSQIEKMQTLKKKKALKKFPRVHKKEPLTLAVYSVFKILI